MGLLHVRRARTLVWSSMLAGSVVVGGFAASIISAQSAQAHAISVTTSGTITSGSDPSNILGVGTNLSGDPYTLDLNYDGIGAGYYTDGDGGVAQDYGDAITGSLSVTVNGATLATALLTNTSPSLTEDSSDIIASNSGNDLVGNFAFASQDVGSNNNFVSFADLQTPFSYTLVAGDTGLDSFSFSNASNTASVSFAGTPKQVAFAVPEPASWGVLLVGLLGLVAAARRRRA